MENRGGKGKETQTNEKKVNEGWGGSVFLSVSLPPRGIIPINGKGDPLQDSVCEAHPVCHPQWDHSGMHNLASCGAGPRDSTGIFIQPNGTRQSLSSTEGGPADCPLLPWTSLFSQSLPCAQEIQNSTFSVLSLPLPTQKQVQGPPTVQRDTYYIVIARGKANPNFPLV